MARPEDMEADPMKPEELVEVVEGRGLKLKLKDGQPFVVGNPKELTPVLRNALKANRAELIEYLRKQSEEIPV